jgi:hypothetical protein
MSPKDQVTIFTCIDIKVDAIVNDEMREVFTLTQEVLMRVAQYSQPIGEVQIFCDHLQQSIDLQWQITDRQTTQFRPPQ